MSYFKVILGDSFYKVITLITATDNHKNKNLFFFELLHRIKKYNYKLSSNLYKNILFLQEVWSDVSQFLFQITKRRIYIGSIKILVPTTWNQTTYQLAINETYDSVSNAEKRNLNTCMDFVMARN